MAKNGKRKQWSGAKKNRSRTESPKNNRRSYLVRAVVTVGILMAAVAVLALVQRPNLSGQSAAQSQEGADTALTVTDAEILGESVAEAAGIDNMAGESVLGVEDSDTASDLELPVAPTVGALAPDFTLDDITGQTVSRTSFAGKPMFITFFHSW